MRRRLLASERLEGGTIHKVNVQPAIVVVVEQGDSRAVGLQNQVLLRAAHDVTPVAEAGDLRHVLEDRRADIDEPACGDGTTPVVVLGYLPVIRARIALNQRDPGTAIDTLQVAVPYELGASHELLGALYPVFVRGEALLAARQGVQAAVEFQKILDHRGIVVSDPIGALAHLQLARALALSGDKIKSKAAYQDFFTLWKDADRDIPLLVRANSEYARLN